MLKPNCQKESIFNTNLTSPKKAVFPHQWLIKNPYLRSSFTLLILIMLFSDGLYYIITLSCIQVNQIYFVFSPSAYLNDTSEAAFWLDSDPLTLHVHPGIDGQAHADHCMEDGRHHPRCHGRHYHPILNITPGSEGTAWSWRI